MPITSNDIAKLAGVSRGTVDRVINNRPGVKKETREKVEEIIKELGYVPSRAGKALSTARKPMTIGIVITTGENPFFDDVIQGMEACKDDYTDFTLRYEYRFLEEYSVALQKQAIHELITEHSLAFLVVTPINHPDIAKALDAAVEKNIPVITVNSDIQDSQRLLHVGCDYYTSGKTAAGLIRLMVPKPVVGVVTGSQQILGHKQRVEGFLSLLPSVSVVEGQDKNKITYEKVKELLQRYPEINTLYFAASGVKGGIRALEEDGRECSILTCDDVPYIRQQMVDGKIQATVCQEPFRQGYEAIHQGLQHNITGQNPTADTLTMKNEIKILENLFDT